MTKAIPEFVDEFIEKIEEHQAAKIEHEMVEVRRTKS